MGTNKVITAKLASKKQLAPKDRAVLDFSPLMTTTKKKRRNMEDEEKNDPDFVCNKARRKTQVRASFVANCSSDQFWPVAEEEAMMAENVREILDSPEDAGGEAEGEGGGEAGDIDDGLEEVGEEGGRQRREGRRIVSAKRRRRRRRKRNRKL